VSKKVTIGLLLASFSVCLPTLSQAMPTVWTDWPGTPPPSQPLPPLPPLHYPSSNPISDAVYQQVQRP
jgi:hypothetical protein